MLVPLKSGAPLRVNITGSAIDLAPSDRPEGHARVRAHGALRFEGLAQIERYGLGRLVDVAPGLIRVGPGAIASKVRADGDAVVASLEVGPIELVDARFACSALATTDELASSLEPMLGPESFGAREVPLRLRRAPSESAPQIAALSGSIALRKLSEKAGWAQVRVEFRGGSVITGWTESAALEPLPSGYQSAAPVARAWLVPRGLRAERLRAARAAAGQAPRRYARARRAGRRDLGARRARDRGGRPRARRRLGATRRSSWGR